MKDKRQNEILKLLLNEQTLKTEYLAEHFDVSIETIRRDINSMEQAGLIKKVYGGVSLLGDSFRISSLDSWNTRLEKNHEDKVKIVTKALDLIHDNSVIALDIGTTTYELSRLLGSKKGLSIITNSLLIAGELAKNTSHKVYCIGGMVMAEEAATGGLFARMFLDNFASIDLFIGSADGISLHSGITEFNEIVVDVKQQLIQRAKKSVFLIDHSKFGNEAMFCSCSLSQASILVTDSGAPERDLNALRKLGIEVIIA